MKKWVRNAAGGIALLLGLAGLLMPILPGWLLIGVGLVLLAPDVPLFGRWLHSLERRFPSSRTPLHRLRQWLD